MLKHNPKKISNNKQYKIRYDTRGIRKSKDG